MDKEVASARLRMLASNHAGRSKAARLRDVYDDVEAALSAGVPRAVVLNELSALGLEMSLATFETTLKRIRQNRARVTEQTALSGGGANSAYVRYDERTPRSQAAPTQPTEPASSHRPAELDEIIGTTPDLDGLAKFATRNRK